jgi:hypothetical protein
LAENIDQWRASAGSVDSVDLRFARQVVVNPESKTVAANMKSGAPPVDVQPAVVRTPIHTAAHVSQHAPSHAMPHATQHAGQHPAPHAAAHAAAPARPHVVAAKKQQ